MSVQSEDTGEGLRANGSVVSAPKTRTGLVRRVLDGIRDEAAAQSMRWRLWAPVAFGGGAALYFALKQEPASWPLLVAALVATGLWLGARVRGRGQSVTLPLMLTACLFLGLAGAKLRSDSVAAPTPASTRSTSQAASTTPFLR